MRVLIFFLLLLNVAPCSAQSRFYKLYSGNGFDNGSDIVELPDKSFLVGGSSGSWEQNAQGYLMKLDSLGSYIWSQAYGAQESEEIKRIFFRPGLGYYLAGMSNSWSNGNYDPMLIFTDLDGNQQWIKTYQHPAWERIHDGVQTLDTGLVLVGQRQAAVGAASDVLILRLDKNGDTLWTKTLGSEGPDCANSIVRVSDTTYAVAGQWFVADSNALKGFITLFTDNGQMLWFDTLGALSGEFSILDITMNLYGIQFGGYHLASPTDYDKFSGSVALDGNILTQVAPLDLIVSDDIIQQLAYLPQQDLTILGIQVLNSNTFSEPFDLYFGYADAFYGYWLTGWPSTTILNQGMDVIGNISPTQDGGFVAVGTNSIIVDGQNQLNGGSNIFVIKIDADGSAYIQTDTVFTTNQLVGIESLTHELGLQIFPNPCAEKLNLAWNGVEPRDVKIIDIQGNTVYQKNQSFDKIIDISSLASGMYFVSIDQTMLPLIKN
jgi:hypothetical protein